MRKSTNHPTEVDLMGAERAILRIQEVYQFTTKQLITGEIVVGEKQANQLTGE